MTCEGVEYLIEVTESEGITFSQHEIVSISGIAYTDFSVDISRISTDDIVLSPLFTRVMMDKGAREHDNIALSRKIGTHAGVIGMQLLISPIRRE